MQMHDTLRPSHTGSAVDALASSFAITSAQAEAVMRAAAPEFAWALETQSLNRGGLADLVEALGRIDQAKYLGTGNVFQEEAARVDGNGLLALLFGAGDARDMLAADIARRTGLSDTTVAGMLSGLAVLTVAALAGRVRSTLGALLARMPSLGRWSKGSPHADLADILRRHCGGGPYASRQLRRAVRTRLARAGDFGALGMFGWYLRFMLLRPVRRLTRPMLSRVASA